MSLRGIFLAAASFGIGYYALKELFYSWNLRQRREYPLEESDKLRQKTSRALDGRYRIVYIANKLGPNVPLIVFIHGLGGQIIQFENQILHFAQSANVLAIDLLGHGQSDGTDDPRDYRMDKFADDMVEIFHQYKLKTNIFIGHSFGSALINLMYPRIKDHVQALVLIGTRMTIPKLLATSAGILVPEVLFDLIRLLLSFGGRSVNEMLSPNASEEVRMIQQAVSLRSSTTSLLRIIRHTYLYPTISEWAKFDSCPILLICGECDKVSPMEHSASLHNLTKRVAPLSELISIPDSGHVCMMEKPGIVNAFIGQFLITECSIRSLDPVLQLTEMIDPVYTMKNYEKWKHTVCVSQLVGNSKIRAVKVMRQGDDEHSPAELNKRYPRVALVIDISKDEPPYDHSTENMHGIEYVKIPTRSKIPPSKEVVKKVILAIEDFTSKRQELFLKSQSAQQKPPIKPSLMNRRRQRRQKSVDNRKPKDLMDFEIALHCHYGFNRTGFVICCYLIEKLGYSVEAAIKAFQEARPPGIKHSHFKDELFLRYSMGSEARVISSQINYDPDSSDMTDPSDVSDASQ